MKILIVTGTYSPSANGVAISTKVLLNCLLKLGHKVLLLAPKSTELVRDEKEVVRYPSLNNPFVVDYPIPLFPLTLGTYEKIKKFKPDIIHVHHPFHIGFFAKYISDIFKIPLVFTYHTKHDYYAKEYFKFLPKDVKPKFVGDSVMEFCKKCDLIITPSNEIHIFLKKNGVLNVATIPTIVDDLGGKNIVKSSAREELHLEANKKILLYVGRIAVEKNISLLVDAVSKIPDDFILLICGSGPLEKEIRFKIKDKKLNKKVFLVGKISRDLIGKYYRAADFFCCPSNSETQGLVYWEALSFGLPIVSVDSLVAREWVKPGFGLISTNSSANMAKKIIEISGLDYKKMSVNAHSFSKKFSSKKSALKMINEYKRLVVSK